MFIAREWELSQLNKLWNQDKFQLFILYGRRRVGKTALLKEFCKDKPAIFFSAGQSNEHINLDKFSQIIYQYYNEENAGAFTSMEKALSYINYRQQDEQLVVVLDEFPYLAANNKALLSDLQHLIDFQLSSGKLFLVLCGSYMGFMEKEVLGAESPLFGRRTAQFKLKTMDYLDSSKFLTKFSHEDQLKLYGVLGGTPMYLNMIDFDRSADDNIQELFLNPMGYLYDEANMLLRQEVKELATYSSIIEAIASGASRANEIATKTGEEAAKCLKYIKQLEALGLVQRETPLGDKPSSRKTVYRLCDLMFVFWYRYVARYHSQLENGAGMGIWTKRMAPDMNNLMGHSFERICHEYVIRKNNRGELPFFVEEIGHWWGSNPHSKEHEQVELDLVARSAREYIFGECKWRNELLDAGVVKSLQAKADVMAENRGETWFMLFSKSGFTAAAKAMAEQEEHIMLISLEELFS